MNNTNILKVVLFLAFLSVGITLKAQSQKKEVYILYNSELVRAISTPDGIIEKVFVEGPNFLDGFKLTVYDYIGHNSKSQDAEVDNDEVFNKNDSLVEVPEEVFTLQFERQKSSLSFEVIASLNQVVERVLHNPSLNIMAISLSKNDDMAISEVRQESIKAYLKIRGIEINKMNFQSYFTDIEVDEVKIKFVK